MGVRYGVCVGEGGRLIQHSRSRSTTQSNILKVIIKRLNPIPVVKYKLSEQLSEKSHFSQISC